MDALACAPPGRPGDGTQLSPLSTVVCDRNGASACSVGVSSNDGPVVAGKVQLAAEYYPEGYRHGGGVSHQQAPDYVQVVPRRQ